VSKSKDNTVFIILLKVFMLPAAVFMSYIERGRHTAARAFSFVLCSFPRFAIF
jgi:hypothetical protein